MKIRKNFKINDEYINNWKIIYVYGNPYLEEEYKLEKNNLIIKCEDSYIHLFKKLILAMKILNKIFKIEQGILRAGDDLKFFMNRLKLFLNKNKEDYIGKNFNRTNVINPMKKIKFFVKTDNLMVNYYKKNKDDLNNKLNNLSNIDIKKYNKIPNLTNAIALGHLYYLSNKSIKILIEYFKKYNNDVFYFNKKKKFYPFIFEDIAVGYILFKNNINLTYEKICGPIHIIKILIIKKIVLNQCFHTNLGNN